MGKVKAAAATEHGPTLVGTDNKGAYDLPHGPTLVGTDNKGAYDLCHRATVGRHSRHVERKVFKMRELRFAGKVKVELVPTKDNASDMLTKALDEHTFARHRDTIMNRKISES